MFSGKMFEYPYIIKYLKHHEQIVKNTRWEKLEEEILKNNYAILAVKYAVFVLEKRWIEAENIISNNILAKRIYSKLHLFK
jgi:hypothetical protein